MKRLLLLLITCTFLPMLLAGQEEVRKKYMVSLNLPQDHRSVVSQGKIAVPDEVRDMVDRVRHTARELGGKDLGALNITSTLVMELTDEQAQRLAKHPDVARVRPPRIRRLLSQETPWGIDKVRAPESWATSVGGGIKVGVVDTGIDFRHEDLGSYAGGHDEVDGDDQPLPDHYHGTHVAGTIAAVNNDIGVVGVAPGCSLYGIRVFEGRNASEDVILRGIEWCVANGMNIINMSFGGDGYTQEEYDTYLAVHNAGILLVGAAGNDGNSAPVLYPAAFDWVLTVGAISSSENIASFSNTGPSLDLVAPGVNVRSTMPLSEGGSDVQLTADGAVVPDFSIAGSPGGEASGLGVAVPGIGSPEDFALVDVAGKIAVVERGTIPFREKSANAYAAGAVACIIYNNTTSDPAGWSFGSDPGNYVPTVGVRQADGPGLVGKNLVLAITTDDYASLDGTSMAAPHVAGAAAVVWAADPSMTSTEVIELLRQTARDLGPAGFDNTYGYGVVDVAAALDAIGTLVPVVDLENGVTLTGQDLGSGEVAYYRLEVGSNAESVTLTTSGGTGDVDLYVRAGDKPTTSIYDGASTNVGNGEEVTLDLPTAGSYYVMLQGLNAATDVSVTGTWVELPPVTKVYQDLQDGVALDEQAAGVYTHNIYRLDVGPNAGSVTFSTSGGSGDLDLYVRLGGDPTPTLNDGASESVGNGESITIESPAEGTWYVLAYPRAAYDGVSVLGDWEERVVVPGGELENDVPILISGNAGDELRYTFQIDPDALLPKIKTYGGTGDVDLYVANGREPTTSDYDYRNVGTGTDESITIWDQDPGGTWHILVLGVSGFDSVSLEGYYRVF